MYASTTLVGVETTGAYAIGVVFIISVTCFSSGTACLASGWIFSWTTTSYGFCDSITELCS